MRRVKKGQEPKFLKDWKGAENSDWEASFENLLNPTKAKIHEWLIEEQGGTCCYCGRSITLSNSHIEHFRPQARYDELDVSYDNLFASCNRETKPASPLHCGHLKGNWFDEACHICPLDQNCEEQFSYSLTGEVIPLTAAAQIMCNTLGLNVVVPREERKSALNGVFTPDFLSSVTLEELRTIGTAFVQPDADGRLTSCFHVIARYAEQLQKSPDNAGISPLRCAAVEMTGDGGSGSGMAG